MKLSRFLGEVFQRINFFPLGKFRVVLQFSNFLTIFFLFAKNFNTVVKNALTCPALDFKKETNLCRYYNIFFNVWNFSNLFQFCCNISSGMLKMHSTRQRITLRQQNCFVKTIISRKFLPISAEKFKNLVNIFRLGFWNFIRGVQRNIFMWNIISKTLAFFE